MSTDRLSAKGMKKSLYVISSVLQVRSTVMEHWK